MGGVQYQRSGRVAALDDLFADNLYAARTNRRVTRQELAQRTGLPFSSIEKIETGHSCAAGTRRKVSIGEAVVLAEALGLKPGDLLKARAATDD